MPSPENLYKKVDVLMTPSSTRMVKALHTLKISDIVNTLQEVSSSAFASKSGPVELGQSEPGTRSRAKSSLVLRLLELLELFLKGVVHECPLNLCTSGHPRVITATRHHHTSPPRPTPQQALD